MRSIRHTHFWLQGSSLKKGRTAPLLCPLAYSFNDNDYRTGTDKNAPSLPPQRIQTVLGGKRNEPAESVVNLYCKL
jgi:hypothetical protein